MNTYDHVYIEYDGQKYYDYCLISERVIYGKSIDAIIVDGNVELKLSTLNGLVDTTIFPPKGTEVHIVPDCPVSIEDLRRNYKIKRKMDEGDYNVFSPLTANRCGNSFQTLAIFPDRKLILAIQDVTDKATTALKLKELGIDPINEDWIYVDKRYFLRTVPHASKHKMLLDGVLEKPCIGYQQLNLNTDNELTLDALTMIFMEAAKDYETKANREHFATLLHMLNQHNWREYPGTMSLLFSEMLWLKPMTRGFRSNLSRWPKAVKEIFAIRTSRPYASDKDFNLAQSFIDSLLKIGNQKFATAAQLYEKLRSISISQKSFNVLYNNVVKINPKHYTSNE